MHGVHGKSISGAHHGADVGVVFKILNRDVQRMPAGINIGDDCFAGPVAVGVNDVAAVALGKQFGVIMLTGGKFTFPGAYAVAAFIPFGLKPGCCSST